MKSSKKHSELCYSTKNSPSNNIDGLAEYVLETNINNISSGTVLVDSQIKALCSKGYLICDGYDAQKVEAVSYNLTIDSFSSWNVKETSKDDTIKKEDIDIVTSKQVILRPFERVFITSKESIYIPPNMIGHVIARNSYITTGLIISSPLYQPGHRTKVTTSVVNVSKYDIKLSHGDSISHIYFETLSKKPDKIYGSSKSDRYQHENGLTFPNEKITTHIIENNDVDQKMNSLEAKIYTVVVAFMAAFVSVLCLIITNFDGLANRSVCDIIKINISLAVCISIILGLVFLFSRSFILNPKRTKPKKTKPSRIRRKK